MLCLAFGRQERVILRIKTAFQLEDCLVAADQIFRSLDAPTVAAIDSVVELHLAGGAAARRRRVHMADTGVDQVIQHDADLSVSRATPALPSLPTASLKMIFADEYSSLR